MYAIRLRTIFCSGRQKPTGCFPESRRFYGVERRKQDPREEKASTSISCQSVKGMHDIYGLNAVLHDTLLDASRLLLPLYGYRKIETPIVEAAHVFERPLGSDSPVVEKELYKFTDKSDGVLTLRPEGTAGIARAVVSNGLFHALPQRLYYAGPMFRYERPQRGRQRQFEQIGVEAFGLSDPLADVELIAMAHDFLSLLGLQDYTDLRLNTLGAVEERVVYEKALRAYLNPHMNKLSPESQQRIHSKSSVLCILDSKHECDQLITSSPVCPQLHEFLSPASLSRFESVKEGLASLGLSFRVDPVLVRGLDYYSHTVFEMGLKPTAPSHLGSALGPSQSTLLAGGRYDGLVEKVAGKKVLNYDNLIAGLGWAAGVQRLLLLLKQMGPSAFMVTRNRLQLKRRLLSDSGVIPVLLIRIPPSTTSGQQWSALSGYALKVARTLRTHGCVPLLADVPLVQGENNHLPSASKQLMKMMKQYTKEDFLSMGLKQDDHETVEWCRLLQPVPQWAVFIGEEEMSQSFITLKNLKSREQRRVSLTEQDGCWINDLKQRESV